MAKIKKIPLPEPLMHIKFDQIKGDDDSGYSFYDEANKTAGVSSYVRSGPEHIVLDEIFGRCFSIPEPGDVNSLGSFWVPGLNAAPEGQFTLAIWVRCGPNPSGPILISSNDSQTSWALRVRDRLEFIWIDESVSHDDEMNEWNRLVSPLTPDPEHWVHVAISASPEAVRMYINGSLAQEIKDTGPILNTNTDGTIGFGASHQISSELIALRQTLEAGGPINSMAFYGTEDELVLNMRLNGVSNDNSSGSMLLCGDALTGSRIVTDSIPFQNCHKFTIDEFGNYIEAGTRGLATSDKIVPSDITGQTKQVFWFEDHDAFENNQLHEGLDLGAQCFDVATTGDGVLAVVISGSIKVLDQRAEVAKTFNFQIDGKDGDEPSLIEYDPYGKCFFAAVGHNLTMFSYNHQRVEPISGDDGLPFHITFDANIIALATPTAATETAQSNQAVKSLAVLTQDGKIYLVAWDMDENGETVGLPYIADSAISTDFHEYTGHCICFDKHGYALAVGFENVSQVFDVYNDEYRRGIYDGGIQFDNIGGTPTAIALSPQGDLLAIAGEDGSVRLWDVEAMVVQWPMCVCDFAGLRIYDETLSQLEVEQVALADLPSVQVGSVFPLDFSLHNSSQQQALFLTENCQELFLEITNIGDVSVVIPNHDELVNSSLTDAERHVIELKFRPNTLKKTGKGKNEVTDIISLIPMTDSEEMTTGHRDNTGNWALSRGDDLDNNDVLRLVHTGKDVASRTLLSGETQYIRLSNIRANCDLGTHSTRVQMAYRLRHLDGSAVMGSRLHYMRVLNMSDADMVTNIKGLGVRADQMIDSLSDTKTEFGSQIDAIKASLKLERKWDEAEADMENHLYFEHGGPLAATIIGSDVVVNDGAFVNKVVVRIRPQQPLPFTAVCDAVPGEKWPTITLFTYDKGEPSWGVLDQDDLDSPVKAKVLNVDHIWTVDHENSTSEEIRLQNKDATDSDVFHYVDVQLTFSCGRGNAKVDSNPVLSGRRHIGIVYTNIRRADNAKPAPGWLSVEVTRAKLLPTDAGVTAAGTISMVSGAELGFHQSGAIGTIAADAPDSAVWESSSKDGLKVASSNNIALHPGVAPASLKNVADTRGFILSKGREILDESVNTPDVDGTVSQVDTKGKAKPKHQSTTAQLDGRLTAIDGIDAKHADITGGSLSIAGDAIISGNVQPKPDKKHPAVGNYLVPRGAILMWHGAYDTIPDDWAMCDGTRGTPNLQSHFIVAASYKNKLYPNLSPYGVTEQKEFPEALNLDIDHMPSHNHNFSVDEGDGHDHGLTILNRTSHDSDGNSWPVLTPNAKEKKPPRSDFGKTGIDWDKVMDYQGSAKTIEMRPAYFALFYIMKL